MIGDKTSPSLGTALQAVNEIWVLHPRRREYLRRCSMISFGTKDDRAYRVSDLKTTWCFAEAMIMHALNSMSALREADVC